MSLAIDIDEVVEVLLTDGWHKVLDNSFCMDSYEFVWGKTSDRLVHGGGQNGICALGFEFSEVTEFSDIRICAGPLTSILAIRKRDEQRS